MKSIVQEGSSVAKAVEKALQIAGNPREFTVKVLEEPQKNFFGMTTKSAKISLFFDIKESVKIYPEKTQSEKTHKVEQQKHERPRVEKPKAEKPRVEKQQIEKASTDKQSIRPIEKRDIAKAKKIIKDSDSAGNLSEKSDASMFWTDAMVNLAKEWLQKTIQKMELAPIEFKLDVNRFYLRITFVQPLNNDQEKERQLFRSFSYLILQTLRTKLQRPLRGFKVVLTRG